MLLDFSNRAFFRHLYLFLVILIPVLDRWYFDGILRSSTAVFVLLFCSVLSTLSTKHEDTRAEYTIVLG